MSLRPELEAVWQTYAAAAGAHEGWPVGAVYMRESKREQVEGFSPTAQLKGTLEHATAKHIWIPAEHVFFDLMSGRREDRVAFQDLLALARAGAIAAVLVLHTSRWARNAMISRRYKDELRARGVTVLALNAPFDIDRPEGKFAERLMEAADEFASDTIGFWVGVGLREKHERGLPLGRVPETFLAVQTATTAKGSPIYAYTPHPELSAIVLEGARRYVAGDIGLGDLAKWAAREGFRTPRGRILTDEWWRNALANPMNAGYLGYRRKRGGTELRRASFDGFMPLETYQQLQATRRRRTRTNGHAAAARAYPLSGARCNCGGKVTSMSKQRMRCRTAQQHAGCDEPSIAAIHLEREFGMWLNAATSLRDQDKARLAPLVRAQLLRGTDAGKASRLRIAMKRLTDAFTWGALEEDDYRAQLADLRSQIERVEQVPDERRILEATQMALDFAGTWAEASPELQRQITWAICSRIKVERGTFTEVDVRKEVAPLFALAASSSTPRSRPDSNRRSRP